MIFVVIGFFKADDAMEKIVHINKEVTVPNLTGLKFEQAKETLEKLKLGIEKDSEVVDKKTKKGRIVSQFPLQDSVVREGRTIKVVVSKGGTGAEMPSVIGIEQREAETILKNAGCIIGQEEFSYSMTVPAESVIDQNPKPLAIFSRGTFVNLKISKGLPPQGIKLMPNVLGLKKEVIEILLSSLGVDPSFEMVLVDKEEKRGIAIGQEPSVDDQIAEGQTVYIKIGE
jgi:serine/threonine-protein kinase